MNPTPTPSHRRRNKGQGAKKKSRYITKCRRVGLVGDTVEIKLASSDDEYSVNKLVEFSEQFIPLRDDSKLSGKPDQCRNDVVGTSKIRMLWKSTSVGMSGGRKRHQPYAVVDSGAEHEIVGGDGWHILHFR